MKKILTILTIALMLILFLGCTQTSAPDTNNLGVPTQPNNDYTQPTQPADNAGSLTINVTKADTNFVLIKYSGMTKVLNYTLSDPKLTLSSNQAEVINATIEIYDDTNNLVTASNSNNVYLQKGNQVISIPSGITVNSQGKYSVLLKLSTKDGDELYSKTFDNLLVGITSYPANKSVDLEVFAVKYFEISYYGDKVIFSLKAKNTGNSDVLGYYKIETSINGSPSVTNLRYGFDKVGNNGDYIWDYQAETKLSGGRIFIAPGKEYLSNYATTETYEGVIRIHDCKKGDKIDIKVSFIESIENSPRVEGQVLGTVNVPQQICFNE